MKAVKFLFKTILWIVALVLVAVLTIPLWINPVVCGVANKVAPGITKTDFHLGIFKLNPYTGHLVVGDLQLGNPTNYSEKNAVDLAQLEVKVDMLSLFGPKIRVECVDLGALRVFSAFDAGNFLQIAKNVQGDKKPEEASSAETKEEAPAEAKPGKGVQIDKLAIHDVRIKYGVFAVPFSLTLTGIGADKEGGVSYLDVFNEIKDAVLKSLTGAAGKIGDQLKNLGNLTGAATNQAADAATKAASAVTDGAAGATKAVGDAAAGATKAAGDAASKALDSIKSLW